MKSSPTEESTVRKIRRYFLSAYVFLFLMSLLWSVDLSITMILFGIALACASMGLIEWWKQRGPIFNTRWRETSDYKWTYEKSSFKNSTKQQPGGGHLNVSRKAILALTGIIFFVIGVMIAASIVITSFGYDESVYYFEVANQYYASGNYDSALVYYRRAIKADPEYAEAYSGYGNVMISLNRNDSARMMYDQSLSIDPFLHQAIYGKADVWYNEGKFDDAIGILKPMLEDAPDDWNAMLLMGDCYYAKKSLDEALAWYSNAYDYGGIRSHMLCYLMAYIHDTKGNYEQAIELYKEALEYDNAVVAIYTRLGELLPGEDGDIYRVEASRMKSD